MEEGPMSQTNPVAVSEARSCAAQCSGAGLLSWARALVPILSWLPAYRWREDALSDLVAGLTVAIMHIPQVNSLFTRHAYCMANRTGNEGPHKGS